MKIKKRFEALLFLGLLFHVAPTASAQDIEIVTAELGGVSVVSIPQPSPLPGLLATKVVLRTAPENKLVTFENVRISGEVHQVWIPGLSGPPTPTPFVDSLGWRVLPPEWIAADSHIVTSPSMVVGEVENGLGRMVETNDLSDVAMARQNLPHLGAGDVPPETGVGDSFMESETDSFSLLPEFQTNEIEFAYVVTPDESTGAAGDVFLTVGVHGEGIINSGEPGGASFGFNGNDPVLIPFIPEPSTVAYNIIALVAMTYLGRRPRRLR